VRLRQKLPQNHSFLSFSSSVLASTALPSAIIPTGLLGVSVADLAAKQITIPVILPTHHQIQGMFRQQQHRCSSQAFKPCGLGVTARSRAVVNQAHDGIVVNRSMLLEEYS
jgi:hypothetical protein